MDVGWLDVAVPAVVSVVVTPTIAYLFGRPASRADAAFTTRVAFYQELYTRLTDYATRWREMPSLGPPAPPPPAPDADEPVLPAALQRSMSLHASPVLTMLVIEFMAGVTESKTQWSMIMLAAQQAAAEEPHSLRAEWAHHRRHEHLKRKGEADKWARESLERIRRRMRHELYGWRQLTPWLKLRAKVIGKRSQGRQTNFFTGGVDTMPSAEFIAAHEARQAARTAHERGEDGSSGA